MSFEGHSGAGWNSRCNMSNNAVSAYNDGMKPLNEIRSSDRKVFINFLNKKLNLNLKESAIKMPIFKILVEDIGDVESHHIKINGKTKYVDMYSLDTLYDQKKSADILEMLSRGTYAPTWKNYLKIED